MRCLFLTRPKLKIRTKRPKKWPKGYPFEPKTLGERIRKHRMDLGWFQRDVARFIRVVTDTVANWEKNRTKPSKRYLKRIKQFLRLKG